MSTERFKNVTSFVINLLNNKTIILLNLAEYCLILADSAYDLVGLVSDDIPRDFAGKLLTIYLRATRDKMASGLHPWQVKKSSKLIVCGVYYLTVLAYTKTTIHLSVGG